MELLSRAIWLAGNLLLACILLRGKRRWGGRFPVFYGYVACVFVTSLVRIYFFAASPVLYRNVYWGSEILGVLFGFGVTWEIYTNVLGRYPGVSRMARTVLGMVLAVVSGKAIVELWGDPLNKLGPTTAELEGTLRFVQTLMLLAILGVVLHYAVPMGRNLSAMLLGYAFYIGCSAVTLSLTSRWGPQAVSILDLVRRLAYIVTLAGWVRGMWVYEDTQRPRYATDEDYDRISGNTLGALGQIRNHLIQSWRP